MTILDPQKPNALDCVNIRRLCFYLDKNIRHIAYEEKHPYRSTIQIFDATLPRVEQFMEDCRLRKAFISFIIETIREEKHCLIKVRFKPTINLNEVTLNLTISPHEEIE